MKLPGMPPRIDTSSTATTLVDEKPRQDNSPSSSNRFANGLLSGLRPRPLNVLPQHEKDKRLKAATKHGDISRVNDLLEAGANPNGIVGNRAAMHMVPRRNLKQTLGLLVMNPYAKDDEKKLGNPNLRSGSKWHEATPASMALERTAIARANEYTKHATYDLEPASVMVMKYAAKQDADFTAADDTGATPQDTVSKAISHIGIVTPHVPVRVVLRGGIRAAAKNRLWDIDYIAKSSPSSEDAKQQLNDEKARFQKNLKESINSSIGKAIFDLDNNENKN